MEKFVLRRSIFDDTLSEEEVSVLIDFFKKEKYIDEANVLTIRYFMFYQNYFIDLPCKLESKRSNIFKCLYRLGYEEKDFMASKADFKKKPVGFKD